MKKRGKEIRPNRRAAADSKLYARIKKKKKKTFRFQYIIFTGRLNKLQLFLIALLWKVIEERVIEEVESIQRRQKRTARWL